MMNGRLENKIWIQSIDWHVKINRIFISESKQNTGRTISMRIGKNSFKREERIGKISTVIYLVFKSYFKWEESAWIPGIFV